MEVVALDVLSENDARVAELKTIVDSEIVEMGTPNFSMVTYTEYSEPGMTALILPFTSQNGLKTTMLLSYFKNGVYSGSFYMEFNPTEAYLQEAENNIDVAFSGDFTIYTENSEILNRKTIIKGIVVDTYTNLENRNCVYNCLSDGIDALPTWAQLTLGGAIGACFGGVMPSCAAVAAFIGGGAMGCLLNDWYC